ncbi:hypothetical protein PPYR_02619 [Photinus pyralis]|uniref:Uncharacterized protein n=1 Tax=Photinus pyralis TaxID=7054 RepID=A0A5N4B7R9_PHOPY|nr:hypothetical protein PPYR_02619 [Photinus pyralis]
MAQRQVYFDEVTTLINGKKLKNNSNLVNLNPFLDEDGVLRVRSRLSNARHMKFNAKFPIILPKQHHITKLIVTYQHRMLLHAGVQATLYALRQNYWVPGGKSVIIVYTCFDIVASIVIFQRAGVCTNKLYLRWVTAGEKEQVAAELFYPKESQSKIRCSQANILINEPPIKSILLIATNNMFSFKKGTPCPFKQYKK